MANIDQLMTRREVFKRAFRIIIPVGVVAATYDAEQLHTAEAPFIQLGLESSPEMAADAFVRADSAFLMASYAVFFPGILLQYGLTAVEAFERAAQVIKMRHPKDHHRLDALPYVASAHLLQQTRDDSSRDRLLQKISLGLKDSRREVREIVLQNLVTSAFPNFDSVSYFSLKPPLIDDLRHIIDEASDNQKLMGPAAMCVEFLLNARALLISRHASGTELKPCEDAINYIRRIGASHLWYLPKLIELHENTFRASIANPTSLPPQSSEALIGWRSLGEARDYLALLATVRARIAFTVMNTASGKLKSCSVMSAEEATRALPKIISFYNAFELEWLLKGSGVNDLASIHEPAFANFLRSEFPNLLRTPERHGFSVEGTHTNAKMIAIKDLVPFAKYSDRGLLTQAVLESNERHRKGIDMAFAAGGITLTAQSIIALASWWLGRKGSRARPTQDMIERAITDIESREKAIDNGQFSGLDEQQESLGNVDLKKLLSDAERDNQTKAGSSAALPKRHASGRRTKKK